ncbi:unnamed protein product, partial [Allacma fusca]
GGTKSTVFNQRNKSGLHGGSGFQ